MSELSKQPQTSTASDLTVEKTQEEPRIGVYVCDCGGNISDVVNCDRVASALGKLPNVSVSRRYQFMCSDIGQKLITDDIKEKGVNRVVVGACSIFLHEQTFRRTVQRAGLNQYLYYHVGLREQDSWVHHQCPAEALDKGIRMMSAGVAKARLMRPLDAVHLSAEKHVLIIGGGVAGLSSALSIARRGLHVTLVEKSHVLGGQTAQWNHLFPTEEDALALVQNLVKDVLEEPTVTILTGAEVVDAKGYVGNFDVYVRLKPRGVDEESSDSHNGVSVTPLDQKLIDVDLKVGAVVVATGFQPYEPFHGEFGYSEFPDVITLPQLEGLLSRTRHEGGDLKWNGHKVRSIAMIHCVGSRQIEGIHKPQSDGKVNEYCSRVCCTATLAAANHIREQFPDVNVYDVYQDIRTYGRGHEDYYTKASKNRVTFLRYHAEEAPVVVRSEKGDEFPLLVKVKDHLTWGEEIELPVDLVVLSVGMMPNPVEDLTKMLKVAPGNDRFLLEVHPKLRPVETAVAGIVLAGTAQAPMNIQESCAAAEAAACKVAILLSGGKVDLEPYVARVDPERCQGSGECIHLCPQEDAIHMETFNADGRTFQQAVVTSANCNGCGVCVSACPNKAIDVQGWRLDEFEAMVEAIAAPNPEMEGIS